ncbi:hypothetical protein ACXIHB_13025 [Tenacibaculum sp. IMCC1]|uniref:Lipoprotein n=1 Tax=Tenacibaculum sp. Pbs-1 TaxID=3238748 RepID=A0AB33KY89_9FLAO
MNKTIKILIINIFFLSFISCKSQKKIIKDDLILNIKDSIVCNNKTERKYNLPYVKLGDKISSKKINDRILIDVKDNIDWFDTFNKEKSLQENLNLFILTNEEKCNEYSLAPFVASYYEIGEASKNIISLKLFFEIYSGSLRVEEYYYNFFLDSGLEITSKDIFKSQSKELLNYLNNKIESELNDFFEEEMTENEKQLIVKKSLLTNLPQRFFLTNENGKGLDILIDSSWANLNFSSVFNVFFSFEELKPFLKEDFKMKVGVE